jgi:uncharacterized membrane protein
MGTPIVLFAGAYEHVASAEGDYEVIKILHSVGDLGAYDAAVISTQDERSVDVHRSEPPKAAGAWIGHAAPAAIGVAFPAALPSLPETGAGVGVWVDHLRAGISAADAREVGELLGEGPAALIVVGGATDAERIEQSAVEATRSTLKQLAGTDFDAAAREALEAMGGT